jgi:hypothetical protein
VIELPGKENAIMDPLEYRPVNASNLSPAKVLLTMRIMWAALLIGPILFMAVIIFMILPNAKRPIHPQPILNWVSFALPAMMIPVAFVIRRLIFSRARTEAGIPPAAYSTGNIVLWASCEGCAFLALVVAMLNASLWPTIIVVAIALSLQAITFPLDPGLSSSKSGGAAPTDGHS